MNNDIKTGIILAVITSLITVSASVLFAAYTSLPQTISWAKLNAGMWNNVVDYLNKAVKQDSAIITVDNTNNRIWIGNPTPIATLDVKWTVSMAKAPTFTTFSAWFNCPTANTSFPYDTYISCFMWWNSPSVNWCASSVYINDIYVGTVESKWDSWPYCIWKNYSYFLPANTNIRFVNWLPAWNTYSSTSWNVIKMWK